MQIAWTQFTPWSALAGGLLIGLATTLFLLGNGRVAGIAGIVASPWRALRLRTPLAAEQTRLLFIGGLLLAPWAWGLAAPLPATVVDVGPLALVAAGL